MFAAKEAYLATKVGETGRITYGGSAKDIAGHEAFAAEVGVLEGMEDQGMVEITSRHHEKQTGKNYVVVAAFKRLK